MINCHVLYNIDTYNYHYSHTQTKITLNSTSLSNQKICSFITIRIQAQNTY